MLEIMENCCSFECCLAERCKYSLLKGRLIKDKGNSQTNRHQFSFAALVEPETYKHIFSFLPAEVFPLFFNPGFAQICLLHLIMPLPLTVGHICLAYSSLCYKGNGSCPGSTKPSRLHQPPFALSPSPEHPSALTKGTQCSSKSTARHGITFYGGKMNK